MCESRANYYSFGRSSLDDTPPILPIRVKNMEKMPADVHENDYYESETRLALLINNKNYSNLNQKRCGSEYDCENMRNLLSQLGYTIHEKHERTADEMLNDVHEFAALFSDEPYESCMVVVMTHGASGNFVGVDETVLVRQEDFYNAIVRNKFLIGKPKIFVVQSCFGDNKHPLAVETCEDSKKENERRLVELKRMQDELLELSKRIPTGADTCFLYSSSPGYRSFRIKEKGTFFIRAFCEIFSTYAHEPWADLATLSAIVTSRVVTMLDSHDFGYSQLPGMETSMTKKFHFFPKPTSQIPLVYPALGSNSSNPVPKLDDHANSLPAEQDGIHYSKGIEYKTLDEVFVNKDQLPVIHLDSIQSHPAIFPSSLYYCHDADGVSKGHCLLINNNDFESKWHPPLQWHRNREGSELDFKRALAMFQQFGYQVHAYNDCTAEEMLCAAAKFASLLELDTSQHKSCVVVIMTHGGDNGILFGTDCSSANELELCRPIVYCERMIGKPKIFIVQACRGSLLNIGMPQVDGISSLIDVVGIDHFMGMDFTIPISNKWIPIGADCCFLHATMPGYLSWRDVACGSWFIEAVCDEFSKHAHKPWADLMTLATRVTKMVAEKFKSYIPLVLFPQLPHTETNMLRKFHFFPPVEQSISQ